MLNARAITVSADSGKVATLGDIPPIGLSFETAEGKNWALEKSSENEGHENDGPY